MARNGSRTATALAAALIWGWAGAAAAAEIVTVARPGNLAPGAGGARFKGQFRDFMVNGAGEVAFWVKLRGNGVTNNSKRGIWAGRPGRLALVARSGDPAPGAGGAVFGRPRDHVINGAGEVAFWADMEGGGVTSANNRAIWVGKPGGLALAVRKGDLAPGAGGAVFKPCRAPLALNEAGELAFRARLRGGGVTPGVNDLGIWAGAPGGLDLVARSGDLAPGAGGAVFKPLLVAPVLNEAGKVAFLADLTGAGVTPDVNDRGIWTGKPGSLALVARRGGSAPRTGGAVFGDISAPLLNGAGKVAFLADLTGSGVTPDINDQGLWAGKPGGLRLVARKGDPAPGTGGAIFGEISAPLLNGAGELAFRAPLTGSGVTKRNNFGIWAGRPGRLALAAREGDRAPGAGGSFFGSFRICARRTCPNIGSGGFNGSGEVAFVAPIKSKQRGRKQGLWAGAPGDLRLIARDDFGIDFLDGTGNEDGRPSAFGEGGHVAFGDSRGIFLSVPD